MKIFKKFLIGLAILIAIPLIVALFVKSNYDVQREILIDQPNQVVFDYVKYLKNQDHYSKWNQMDPDMKKSYKGTDGTVGFVSRWESNNEDVGTGEQEIKKITEGERIDFELRFIKPFEATEPAFMTTEKVGENQTTTNVDLYSIEGRFALNPRLQLIGFYQRNSENSSQNYNIRFSWEYQPLSYIYLVFNQQAFNPYMERVRVENHVITKISYLKQF